MQLLESAEPMNFCPPLPPVPFPRKFLAELSQARGAALAKGLSKVV